MGLISLIKDVVVDIKTDYYRKELEKNCKALNEWAKDYKPLVIPEPEEVVDEQAFIPNIDVNAIMQMALAIEQEHSTTEQDISDDIETVVVEEVKHENVEEKSATEEVAEKKPTTTPPTKEEIKEEAKESTDFVLVEKSVPEKVVEEKPKEQKSTTQTRKTARKSKGGIVNNNIDIGNKTDHKASYSIQMGDLMEVIEKEKQSIINNSEPVTPPGGGMKAETK